MEQNKNIIEKQEMKKIFDLYLQKEDSIITNKDWSKNKNSLLLYVFRYFAVKNLKKDFFLFLTSINKVILLKQNEFDKIIKKYGDKTLKKSLTFTVFKKKIVLPANETLYELKEEKNKLEKLKSNHEDIKMILNNFVGENIDAYLEEEVLYKKIKDLLLKIIFIEETFKEYVELNWLYKNLFIQMIKKTTHALNQEIVKFKEIRNSWWWYDNIMDFFISQNEFSAVVDFYLSKKISKKEYKFFPTFSINKEEL